LKLLKAVRFYGTYPLEFMGGGESTSIFLANYLGENGWSVKFLADSKYSGVTRVSVEAVMERVRSFEYARLPFESRSPLASLGLLRRTPRIEDMPPEYVHLILIDRVPPSTFLADLKRKGLRVLFLLYGIALDYQLPPNPAAAAYEFAQRANLARFGAVRSAPSIHFQVLTGAQSQFLSDVGIPADRIHLIRSGVRIPTGEGGPDDATFRVLFMGRMERVSKGVSLLRQVARLLQVGSSHDVELTMIGSGRDSARIATDHFGGRVRYEGYVTDFRRAELLREAQVLISTSYLEPFSLVVAEAIVNGVYVLTTPASGPASIVNLDRGFGEVLDFSPETFVKRIQARCERWRSSPDHLSTERKERRQTGARWLSEAEMCRRYEDLLSNLT
jgi:glycosyltransferase involved in cell wall biosynthesis